MMADYKEKLGGLASKLKEAAPPTPIQKVSPIKKGTDTEKEVEVQFNNWIPKSLLKKLKRFAVDNDLSLKDINVEALETYLKNKRGL